MSLPTSTFFILLGLQRFVFSLLIILGIANFIVPSKELIWSAANSFICSGRIALAKMRFLMLLKLLRSRCSRRCWTWAGKRWNRICDHKRRSFKNLSSCGTSAGKYWQLSFVPTAIFVSASTRIVWPHCTKLVYPFSSNDDAFVVVSSISSIRQKIIKIIIHIAYIWNSTQPFFSATIPL